jgi:hypothetical protein
MMETLAITSNLFLDKDPPLLAAYQVGRGVHPEGPLRRPLVQLYILASNTISLHLVAVAYGMVRLNLTLNQSTLCCTLRRVSPHVCSPGFLCVLCHIK